MSRERNRRPAAQRQADFESLTSVDSDRVKLMREFEEQKEEVANTQSQIAQLEQEAAALCLRRDGLRRSLNVQYARLNNTRELIHQVMNEGPSNTFDIACPR